MSHRTAQRPAYLHPLRFPAGSSTLRRTRDRVGAREVKFAVHWGRTLAIGVLALAAGAAGVEAAELSAGNLVLAPGGTGTVLVSGQIDGEETVSVTLIVELRSRVGNTGTVTFTPSPPVDIEQLEDPWSGAGTFTPFDTDDTGSDLLNGSTTDNGTFVPAPVTFAGPLAGFPVVASADAGGVWDVLLSTSVGDSAWEGLPTTLTAGQIIVTPSVSLTVESFAMPPDSSTELAVSGNVNDQSTFGVTIMLELVPRAGATGTLTFTPAPPADITQTGDPWPSAGQFSPFDTDRSGSPTLNGSVDDNGSFLPGPVTYDGPLSSFPVVASADAAGEWDVTLTTSVGASTWEGLATVLLDGVVTVRPDACLDDPDCDDGNVCTADACVSGLCEHSPAEGECDDGDLCTIDDVCTDGACAGTPVDCSALDGICTVGVCNESTGACDPVPANEGGACSDDDPCTVSDVCLSGQCTGTPVDCSGLDDACNVGTCDPVTGACISTPANEGQPCDDADPCTENDLCASGECVGGPVDCSSLTDDCNQGACNPDTGLCEATPTNSGGPCDDGDPCNVGEQCTDGVCGGGTPVDCTAVSDPCNTASCDSAGPEGNCDLLTPEPNGTPCDDGLFCTAADACSDGECVGGGDACPGLQCDEAADACVECFVESDCDDGNPCTDDSCVANACVHVDNTAPCDDGDACTLSDVCADGVCVGGSPVDCTAAGDQCNTASCDSAGATGNCDVLTPRPNGTACDDGLVCTFDDQCIAGACAGSEPDCSFLDDQCIVGVCNEANGECEAQPGNEGAACDDGLSCTTDDRCVEGECRGTLITGPRVDLLWSPASQVVQVGQPVRIDLIARSGTCADQPVGAVEAILNWDPTLLSLVRRIRPSPPVWVSSGFPNDSQLDGLNAPFTGIPDNDGDALFAAVSDFSTGVVVPPAGRVVVTFEFTALAGTDGTQLVIPPQAGSFTITRVLGAAEHSGQNITGSLGAANIEIDECVNNADCDDGNVCTTDLCNGGLCELTNNTSPCDDELFCTTDDVCSGGECVGSGNPCLPPLFCSEALDACVECLTNSHCSDGNVCTTDTCTANGTCQHSNNTSPCNDGLFCTESDVCSDGECIGSGDSCPGQVCDETLDRCVDCLVDTDCDDDNVCTDDFCIDNACQHVNNADPCNDGLFCTTDDVCTGGECGGSGDPCTEPLICDENQNACVECITDADCDDGNPCTTDDCFLSVCVITNNTLPCDDGLFCTETDQCADGACVGSGDPCPGQLCDEANNRCVDCFTLADCPDDGLDCTVDACSDGVCVHDPDDAFCNDGLFCNGAEFCSTILGCVQPESPCDDPALCDEKTNTCGCQTPDVLAEGPRYLRVVPRPGDTPVALRLSGISPSVACVTQYVQTDGRIGATPVFQTPAAWGTVHVRGVAIRPNTTYAVQSECDTGAGIGRSDPQTAATWHWADTNNSGPPPTIADVVLIIDGFRGIFREATLEQVDIWGDSSGNDPCLPQRRADIADAVAAIDAFRGIPFSCPSPCP